MDFLLNFFKELNGFIWGLPMLLLLFGTHLFMTFKLKFIQKHILKAIKLSITPDKDCEGDVTQFGALSTALAATLGTGNIIGVSTAVALGGPGAVFWCWLTGIFGMATKYAECLLAVKYRSKTPSGSMIGGTMYALEKGLKNKLLAVLFAVFTLLASFGIGCTVQGNSVSTTVAEMFNIPTYITASVICFFAFIVLIGGVKTISKVCEKLVPLMTLYYIVACAIILYLNRDYILPAISLIVTNALTLKSATGGALGGGIMLAARYGIARGLFSNESGLGSASIAAAAAQTRNPVRQALVSMTGTFWDTVCVCLITGIVLVSNILKFNIDLNQVNLLGKSGQLTSMAFAQLSGVGDVMLAIALVTFAFSTILGWSYYGEKALEYLFGSKLIHVYRTIYVIILFIGSVSSLSVVWEFADCMNGLMAIPNLICVIFLSRVIASETKKYLWNDNLDAISDD